MLDFYADWCVSCKEMEKYTFSDPTVIAALANTRLLQADVTANDKIDQALLQGHFGLPGPPAIIFYGADGQERKGFRVVGFVPAEEFAAHVQRAIR
jgi:thiol:disulfide interchange protein DsbD